VDEPLYDEATERRIDGAAARRRTVRTDAPRRARAVGAGAFMTAIALGLQEVFDPKDPEEVVFELDDPGEPDEDQPVTLDYDPHSAARSRAHVRPWLLSST
jgi:hypothetical protein